MFNRDQSGMATTLRLSNNGYGVPLDAVVIVEKLLPVISWPDPFQMQQHFYLSILGTVSPVHRYMLAVASRDSRHPNLFERARVFVVIARRRRKIIRIFQLDNMIAKVRG